MEFIYDHSIFYELKEFPLAQQCLNESKEKLLELGLVICRYRLHKIVGISLLHKHFDLQSNERLVREIVDDIHYVKPQAKKIGDRLIPYLWKVEHNHQSGEWCYYPLEFIRDIAIGASDKKLTESVMKNYEFLSEMAAKLSELGLADTFGIMIFHQNITRLCGDKFMLEMTDHHTRTNICSLTFANTIEQEDATPTVWRFQLNKRKLSTCKNGECSSFWEFFSR